MGKRESKIENKFVSEIKAKHSIKALKFKDPSRRGGPDRLILMPGGRVIFIEFKRPGEDLREEQVKYRDWLRGLGYEVFDFDNWQRPCKLIEDRLAAYFSLDKY